MKAKWLISLMCAFVLALGCSIAWAVDPPQFPQNATFSTLVTTEFSVEGLTADTTGNLYTAGRVVTNGQNCPVYRVNPVSGANSLVTVGFIPDPDAGGSGLCGPTGLAFNSAGVLFVADGAAAAAKVYSLVPNTITPPTATVFASGVPGANGIAFDNEGNLWVSDGVTGQGRVWKVSGPGANCASSTPVNCEEVFRIQPMANEVNLVGGVGGVGRDVRTLPPGLITVTLTTRNAALNTLGCPTPPGPPCALGSQPLVANGLAFNHQGDLFVADTARGAIWKAEFDRHGNLTSEIGCDTTFTPNTLCLNNIFIAHPILEGVDGIALDRAGNIWASVNERNAIAVVSKDGRVAEVFRNPLVSNLRNTGPLEFPTSPFLSGKLFCTANSDGDRRDNSPNSAGEIKPAGPQRGKISCMDQELKIQGLPLPIN
jgi:sugar lactone lactonase YvrE